MEGRVTPATVGRPPIPHRPGTKRQSVPMRIVSARAVHVGVVALIVMGAAGLGLAVAPTSALAHDACIGISVEPSIACVRNGHKTVDICDRHADGHWVWAQVQLIDLAGSSGDRIISVSDTNGSAPGCRHFTAGELWAVGMVQVAVQYEGYGAWLYMGPPHQSNPPPPPDVTQPPAPDASDEASYDEDMADIPDGDPVEAESDEAGLPAPMAQPALGPAAFAAWRAYRVAVALRAAGTARAMRAASIAARGYARSLRVATASKIKAVRSTARIVARRGSKWLRARWWALPGEARACLATAAFMESYKMLRDRQITRDEWSVYSTFGPRLIPPSEAPTNFPMSFSRNLEEEVIECAIGIGVGPYFAKTRPE